MWHKARAQSSQSGAGRPNLFGRLTSLLWSVGQSLAYFQKPFHTRVTEGRWSRSVMPKISAVRKLGRPATQVGQPATLAPLLAKAPT
jgi:hypothetical protein